MFRKATDRRVEQFTESVSFDRRSYAQDIAGSIGHAQTIAKAGVLSARECPKIEQRLGEIRQETGQVRRQIREWKERPDTQTRSTRDSG